MRRQDEWCSGWGRQVVWNIYRDTTESAETSPIEADQSMEQAVCVEIYLVSNLNKSVCKSVRTVGKSNSSRGPQKTW